MIEGHKVVSSDVEKDAFGDNLLDHFAKAFNELNGSVGAREGVILFVGFGNNND